MSYVGGPFRHDVFVTYTHGDIDGDGQSPLRRWSQSFARELESELRTLPDFGPALKVFLDQHHRPGRGVDPMEPLSEQLKSEISDSALLAVLMSPQYLRSTWCTRERDWWRDAQFDRQISTRSRIALTRIWPLRQQDDCPSLFVDGSMEPLTGFCFYDKANAEMRPQPYEWPEVSRNSKGAFRDELLRMVGWLRLKLNELRETLTERERAREEAAKLAGSEQVLYLHGRADQKELWQQKSEELRDSGFAVLPHDPDPVIGDPAREEALKRERISVLMGCDALLLLGSQNGRSVDADLLLIGRRDRHSARAASKRLLPCAFVNTAGPSIGTSERIRTAKALQIDWIDDTQPPPPRSWVGEVGRWLAQKGAGLGGIE